jgi:tripartite-type tricarboxylate transporter receptor subunit TctC
MIGKVFCLILSGLVSISLAAPLNAQEKYPSKPITWTVGYAAGGVSDVCTRAFAKAAEKTLKQPIVVVNKPGAASSIQLQSLKNSPPDGYTIGTLTIGGILNTHLRETPYDSFNDFVHLSQIGNFLFGIAVHPDARWKNLKEFVEYARESPGKIKYGSFAPGSPATLVGESFAFYNGFKMQLISYDGDTLAATALMGKHIDAVVITYSGWGPLVKAGRLRLLGVFYDARWKEFPDAPTVKELGYNYGGGFGTLSVLGPKNLPLDVKRTLLGAFREASKDPEFVTVMDRNACPITYKEGDDWTRYLMEVDKEAVTLMKQIGYNVIK